MKLPKRLEVIASLIDENTNVIDTGCDHALLDIYLTLNNKNKCIATDVNQNALNNAIQNIKKYNLDNSIETVISNGLENIDIENNNTVVIAGMGANTILNILNTEKTNKINNLIIQSNNDLELLRKKITKLGFYIVNEVSVLDRKKYYVVIKFRRGYKKYNNFEYYYGPIKKDNDYNNYLIEKNKKVINSLPKKKLIKKLKLKNINKKLKKL